jgi:HlyD family secretion protein
MNANERIRPEPVRLPDTHRQDRVLEPRRFWVRRSRLLIGSTVAAALLVAMVLVVVRFSRAQQSADRSVLTISRVERGSFVRDVLADGQVVAAVSPTLYAASAGSVALKVHAGDTVDKDQVVAEIDSPDLAARVVQEDATLVGLRIDYQRAGLDAKGKLSQLREAFAQAQIDQKTAQREVDRSSKAYEFGSYPELQVLRATDMLEKARFAYEQAKRNFEAQPEQNRFDIDSKKALLDRQQYLVTDLRRQVDALQIRSPVTGKIGQVLIEDRASVTRDAPLLSVVDLSALEVEIKVPESLARDLSDGMTADLTGDGRHWTGTVSGVSPQVVNGEVIARVRFGEQKPEGLRQRQRLSVRIFIERRDNVLMVDRGSFLDQDGGGFVYVVNADVAERRPVRLGASGVQKVEILSGLAEGTQIVGSGTDAFRGAERVILTH